jgi:SfnB family sulfur acquisition oxidoreductase
MPIASMPGTTIEISPSSEQIVHSPRPAKAHRVASDEEALTVARRLSQQFAIDAAKRDRERILPQAELDAFSGSGLWALSIPKSYGGAGVQHETLVEMFRIVAEGDPSIAQIAHNHYCVVDAIRLDGSPEQKSFYFEEVLNGKRFGNAFSEAGTKNVTDFQTKIEPHQDRFVINGKKFYSTGALFADYVPTGAVNGEKKGFLVIIPKGTPGLTVIDNWSGFGQRTTASGSVVLENVQVKAEWVIAAHQAYDRPTLTGPLSQIIQAAIDAGIAHAALQETVRFVREKSRPWIDSKVEKASEDPLTISQIGDLAIRVHAAEALLARAARKFDLADPEPTEGGVAEVAVAVNEAKVLTTEAALLATNKLFELAGTQSTLSQYGLDRHWRNARTHTLHDPVRWKYYGVGNYYLNQVLPPRHPWN